MLKVAVKKIDTELPLPEYAHKGDAGCDLRSAVDLVINPGERALVPTGIAIAIPEGYAGFIQPRSGLAATHGITVLNTPGLIDSHYRGEIKVILVNLDKKEPFRIKRGDKVCQLVFKRVETAVFEEVESLPETERGEGGFGSTGV